MKNFKLKVMLLLAVLLCGGTYAFADYSVWQDSIQYGLQYDLTAYVNDAKTDIKTANIPEKITYGNKDYTVTSLGRYAFSQCSNLSSVVIPSSVTGIGDKAFDECSSLASVVIPSSVTSIGYYAFNGCSSLASVVIPSSVTSIESGTFEGCSSLASVVIPNSVTSIRDRAFEGCSSLASVVIPNSVTSIGDCAFEGCSSLASVVIPSSVTSIGNWAFEGCSSLASVVIPSSVTGIGDWAFNGCSNLASVVIPSSVTSIGESAFEDCSSLSSVVIPSSVTSIGRYAFKGCSSLLAYRLNSDYTAYVYDAGDSILAANIPEKITYENKDYTVTSIGKDAFYGCSSLHSVTIGGGVQSIAETAFVEYAYNTYVQPEKVIWLGNTPPEGYENVKGKYNYVSNDSFTGLSNTKVYPFLSSMFEKDGIKYVPTPSERTCYAIDCVYDSTAANINIGKNVNYKGVELAVKDIRPYTCYANKYVKSVKVDYSDTIPLYAFYGCEAITTANITAKTIGASAFENSATKEAAKFEINADTIRDNAFTGCRKMEDAVLGESLKSVGNSAFKDCASLKGITIPDSVTGIGGRCFSGCGSLAYAKIGAGVSVIPDEAFNNCKSLPEITIPKTVERIGNGVFYDCTSLADVTIADRETELKLGSNVKSPMFSSCPLKSVYIGGNITYGTTANDGYSPFYRNTSLETVRITDKETEISENEFYGCTSLKSVSMGDGIDTIGKYAFSGCSALESFSFGTGLKSIGDEAFSDCTGMKKLVSKTATPPVCGPQALDDINKWECTLYVPQESLDAYKSAAQWKEFFFLETGIKNVPNTSSSATESARYSTDGTRIASPQKGINIIRMSDGTVKKVLVK